MTKELAFAPVDKMSKRFYCGRGVNQNLVQRFAESEFDLVEVLEVGDNPRVKAMNLANCAKKSGYDNIKAHCKSGRVYLEKVN